MGRKVPVSRGAGRALGTTKAQRWVGRCQAEEDGFTRARPQLRALDHIHWFGEGLSSGTRGFAFQSPFNRSSGSPALPMCSTDCSPFGRRGPSVRGLEPSFALQVLARIASSCDTRSRSRRDVMAATGRAASTAGRSRKAWDLRPCTRAQMSKVAWSREHSALVGDSSVRATLAPRIPSHAAIRTALTCIVRGPRGLTCRFVRSLDSQEHRDVARGNPRVVVASKHPITNTVA